MYDLYMYMNPITELILLPTINDYPLLQTGTIHPEYIQLTFYMYIRMNQNATFTQAKLNIIILAVFIAFTIYVLQYLHIQGILEHKVCNERIKR